MTTSARQRPALSSRIAELRRRRQHLAAQIDKEMGRPAPCSVMLMRLKQQRVHLKDQITRYNVQAEDRDALPAHNMWGTR